MKLNLSLSTTVLFNLKCRISKLAVFFLVDSKNIINSLSRNAFLLKFLNTFISLHRSISPHRPFSVFGNVMVRLNAPFDHAVGQSHQSSLP